MQINVIKPRPSNALSFSGSSTPKSKTPLHANASDQVCFSGKPTPRKPRRWMIAATSLLTVIASGCGNAGERAVNKLLETCNEDPVCEVNTLESLIVDQSNTDHRIAAIHNYIDRDDVLLTEKVQLLVDFLSGDALSDNLNIEHVVKIENAVIEVTSHLKETLDETYDQDLINILNQVLLNRPQDDYRYETYNFNVGGYDDCHYGGGGRYCDWVDPHQETATNTFIDRRYPLRLDDALNDLERWLDDQALINSLTDENGQLNETVTG